MLLNRGVAWSSKKEFASALADYDAVMRLAPNDPKAYTNAAWLLATCTDARYRNGERAVQLATRACELLRGTDAHAIEALSAAYAETGDFKSAVECEEQVIILLQGDPAFLNRAKQLRLLYQVHRPYRED